MSPRILHILGIVVLCAGVLFLILGSYDYSATSKTLEEYQTMPRDVKPGSSGGGIPAFDSAYWDFEISAVFFAAGGALLVWGKRK